LCNAVCPASRFFTDTFQEGAAELFGRYEKKANGWSADFCPSVPGRAVLFVVIGGCLKSDLDPPCFGLICRTFGAFSVAVLMAVRYQLFCI
jgi:hypothetical protein